MANTLPLLNVGILNITCIPTHIHIKTPRLREMKRYHLEFMAMIIIVLGIVQTEGSLAFFIAGLCGGLIQFMATSRLNSLEGMMIKKRDTS